MESDDEDWTGSTAMFGTQGTAEGQRVRGKKQRAQERQWKGILLLGHEARISGAQPRSHGQETYQQMADEGQ